MKLYLDPGHGGSDSGAVGNGLREKDLNLSIALKIRNQLKNYTGVEVRMSRSTDKFVSLQARTNDANKWGADYFLSIHINAGGGEGYEDFIHTPLSNTSKTAKLRDTMHAEIIKAVDFKNRGKKKANFHVIRESKMPALLTENGFIDNKSDAAKLKQDAYLNKIATGHVNGIVKAFGLKRKVTTPPKQSTPSGKLHKVQIGAFKVKANAENLKKQAEAKGFKPYMFKQGGLWKVQLGAFSVKANATSLEKKAKSAGFKTFVVFE